MNETLEESLINRIFDVCAKVLDSEPVLRMDAIAIVRKEVKIDFAITETYMLKLVDMGILNYKKNRYSLAG